MKDLLKDRERKILELRFGLGGHKPKTQNEIAQMMGISRSYVSRIETKAIGKLAKEINLPTIVNKELRDLFFICTDHNNERTEHDGELHAICHWAIFRHNLLIPTIHFLN